MAVDERFCRPRVPVSVGDSGEALLIRAILENLGAVVTLHLPGVPEDFRLILDRAEAAPRHLVICGHGDEVGLLARRQDPKAAWRAAASYDAASRMFLYCDAEGRHRCGE